jgi:hypothetical protein
MPEYEKAIQRAMDKQSYGIRSGGDRVEVHYYGDGIDIKLDARLKRAMEKAGYEWYASGYDMAESRRDNCFEKVA